MASASPLSDAGPAPFLTLDLDWAPEHVLEDTRQLLEEAGLPVTIFVTHTSPAVAKLASLPGCEVGVHPNFLSGGAEEAVLARLLASFPGAVGVRCHALFYHSRLLPLFHRTGVRYFSNDLMFLHEALAPYYDWSGLVRLPIYWEDDVHCQYFDGAFEVDSLCLERPGLQIFNFHPVHLYLNTTSMDDYQAAKPALADPEAARACRRVGPGIRSLFLAFTRGVAGRSMGTLGQLAERYRAAHAFAGHTARRFAGTDPVPGVP